MTIVAFFQLVGDKLRILTLDRLFPLNRSRSFVGEPAIAKQESRVQQAGLDRDIFLGQAHTFLRRCGRHARLSAHIPERIEHVFDDAFGMRAGLIRPDEEQIDIG